MASSLTSGLLVLHGNRLETLAQATFAWLSDNPLGALDEECFLVQSNGMGEWLKMELAASQGICAATRVELPARFMWRAYRAVLGGETVPSVSPLDKGPLAWRLMQVLPAVQDLPGFEPIAEFLGAKAPAGDASTGIAANAYRRLQLAQRLADLFDQYQVYRSDWLQDWAEGRDGLRKTPVSGPMATVPVPAEQGWQPALWRAVLAGLGPDAALTSRAMLNQRFLAELAGPGPWPHLPRRIVLFGTTHIPLQTLASIAALSAHVQVLMAVPNPCRYHWADIISGRELLQTVRRRLPLRGGLDLAAIDLQDLHAHGHPLLAAWGRQSRDFVRQLDAFDDAQAATARFDAPRVDLFDDDTGTSLLEQIQARIRDLVPLAEHGVGRLAHDDRSVVFHVAHSAQREVEILHDQLLHLLAEPPAAGPLDPRDIVVMVPDIDRFAPAIRAVFGQYPRSDQRHIPWGITDQRERGHHPLLIAVEWLMRAPQQRFTFSELRDLLDVPAVAERFGLEPDDMTTLGAWIEGAGVRWGLGAAQRESLGLAACGDVNTWRFGLRRMMLGYATGELDTAGGGPAGIEPFAEVSGLTAGLIGVLAELLAALDSWVDDVRTARTPDDWCRCLRGLVQTFFSPTDTTDRAALAALEESLSNWLQSCEIAGFATPVDLAVVREAWLQAVDAPGESRRFRAGGVTFCTLLPLRAIPFDVVCLLGMNDGDYPRRSARSDFDLMAQSGLARPGDRSRRDDDRQLMLDALISARRVLYVSWCGRSQRDNQQQPPSVLVAQFRDYLRAGWGEALVERLTTAHPLQPFSRRYFEVDDAAADARRMITYATEWRLAHVDASRSLRRVPAADGLEPAAAQRVTPITVAGLAEFLRNPVRAFFRQRLQVDLDEFRRVTPDDESFDSRGLDRWQLLDEVLAGLRDRLSTQILPDDAIAPLIDEAIARLRRAGRLPMAGPGLRIADELMQTLVPMLARWHDARQRFPHPRHKWPLRLTDPDGAGMPLNDWMIGLSAARDDPEAEAWLELNAGRLADKKVEEVLPDKLLRIWVRSLALAASGRPATAIVIGSDAIVTAAPEESGSARSHLLALLRACQEGLTGDEPMPTAVRTGLALVRGDEDLRNIYEGNAFAGVTGGEGREAALARLFPNLEALVRHPRFEECSRRLYEPFDEWLTRRVTLERLVEAKRSIAGDEGGQGMDDGD